MRLLYKSITVVMLTPTPRREFIYLKSFLYSKIYWSHSMEIDRCRSQGRLRNGSCRHLDTQAAKIILEEITKNEGEIAG
jgi:hypothetical protein